MATRMTPTPFLGLDELKNADDKRTFGRHAARREK